MVAKGNACGAWLMSREQNSLWALMKTLGFCLLCGSPLWTKCGMPGLQFQGADKGSSQRG